VKVRLRCFDGSYRALRVFLAPLQNHPKQALGFVLRPEPIREDPPLDSAARLEEVEHRLRRIALELAALGVTEGLTKAVRPDILSTLARLTPKRQEIVRRLRAGERVPGIARDTYVSQSTIRNHLSAIFREFGVTSQEELLALMRDVGTDHR
jgi:DNA-binding CsgD family transcriptional regulator